MLRSLKAPPKKWMPSQARRECRVRFFSIKADNKSQIFRKSEYVRSLTEFPSFARNQSMENNLEAENESKVLSLCSGADAT